MESPIFFNNEGLNIFGVLHTPEVPAGSASGERPGFVLCSPFAEEKMIAHRPLVMLARKLTDEGYPVLRFDYMGNGDSEGSFEDSTVETMLSDLQCAVDYLRKETGAAHAGLIGVRFGATLAALACADMPGISRLVLIAPIISGKAYIDQCLRSNLTSQMMVYKKILKDRAALISDLMSGKTVNIDGYLLSGDMYRQMEAIDLVSGPRPAADHTLLLQVSDQERPPRDEKLMELYDTYRAGNGSTQVISLRENRFYQELKINTPRIVNVEKAIVDWLAMTTV